MFCTYCGAKLRDGAKFCTSCGKPVRTNTVNLAKAGAKQILAALKDRDINASATPGEVSCKPDAAQSAFMKLLKKGLLVLAMLLALPSALSAQNKLSQVTGPFTVSLSNGNPALTYTVEFEGAVASGETFDGGTTFYPSGGNTPHTEINGYFHSKDYVIMKVRVEEDFGVVDNWEVATDSGEAEKLFRVKNGILGETLVSETRDLSKGSEAVFKIPVPSNGSHLYIHLQIRQKVADGYKSWVQQGREFTLAMGDAAEHTINSDAGDSGENGWVVPAAIAGALGAGGLALKGRKKKKVAAKKPEKASKDEKKKSDDDKQDEDDEDDEENATYEMRIRKDFGDTLTPGGGPQNVYARIVRIPQGGTAATDSGLTSKISITGDGYLNVSGQRLAGGYMSASVEAPQGGSIPDEAVVNFRLTGGGGAFTNRMHFKIAKSEIIFFQ